MGTVELLGVVGGLIGLGLMTLAGRRHLGAASHSLSTSARFSKAGTRELDRRRRTLRPSLEKPMHEDLGYRLGAEGRHECWASVEDSIVVLGPPRSGKGLHLCVPMILDAPGVGNARK